MDAVEILKDLVAIPSYKQENQKKMIAEERVAKYIERFIKNNCPFLSTIRQKVKGTRYNIIASDGDYSEARLIFFCHMDTVTAKAEQIKQTENGFVSVVNVEEDNEKIYGLGSVDMKGGTAALLACLSNMKKKIRGLAIVFYCDEEFQFEGMKRIKDLRFNAEFAVFCEPSDLKISNGCRGLIEFSGKVIGETCHAKDPADGKNAILVAVKVFNLFAQAIEKFSHKDLGPSVCNLAGIHGGLETMVEGERVIKFEGNSIPDVARVIVESRTADQDNYNIDTAIKLFKKLVHRNGCKFELENIMHNYGALFTPKEELTKVINAIKKVGLEVKFSDIKGSGYYDAEIFFRKFKIPCISLGPAPSDMCHKRGEYVTKESLKIAEEIYFAVIKEFGII